MSGLEFLKLIAWNSRRFIIENTGIPEKKCRIPRKKCGIPDIAGIPHIPGIPTGIPLNVEISYCT